MYMSSIYNIISLLLLFVSPPTSSSRWTCNEEGQCEDRNLICSSREDCFVECSANWACRGTTVECPTGYECHVKCHYDGEGEISEYGQYICYNMAIQATDSTLLTINVSIGFQPTFPAPRTMQNARITCPHKKDVINGDNGEHGDTPNGDTTNGDTTNGDNGVYKPCQIYCDGDDLMRVTTINAMEGMNDLHIESIHYTKPWCVRNTELNCGIDYAVSCPLTNIAPFGCQDLSNDAVDQSCETMVVGPTSSPTSETISPLKAPSQSPIMDGSPSETPTPAPIASTLNPGAAAGDLDTETTSDIGEEKGGLTNGEMVIVIIIPLFFVALIFIGCGCYWMRKKDKQNHKRITSDDDHDYDEDDDNDGLPDYDEEDEMEQETAYRIKEA